MTNANIHKETKLERAQQKLISAVEGLEAVLEEKLAQSDGANPEVIALTEELTELRSDNARLKLLNKTVNGRLDNTIGRLETVLET